MKTTQWLLEDESAADTVSYFGATVAKPIAESEHMDHTRAVSENDEDNRDRGSIGTTRDLHV